MYKGTSNCPCCGHDSYVGPPRKEYVGKATTMQPVLKRALEILKKELKK